MPIHSAYRSPALGRTVPTYDDPNLRELIVYPYRLIYRVLPDRIDVIAVFHGAQQLPGALWVTDRAYWDHLAGLRKARKREVKRYEAQTQY